MQIGVQNFVTRTPPRFDTKVDLAAKDLRLILGFAAEVGAPMPQATLNLEQVNEASRALGGERDLADVADLLRGETA